MKRQAIFGKRCKHRVGIKIPYGSVRKDKQLRRKMSKNHELAFPRNWKSSGKITCHGFISKTLKYIGSGHLLWKESQVKVRSLSNGSLGSLNAFSLINFEISIYSLSLYLRNSLLFSHISWVSSLVICLSRLHTLGFWEYNLIRGPQPLGSNIW